MSGILFNGNVRTSRNLLKNPAFSVIQSTASGTIPSSLAVATASLGYSGETEWCLAAAGGTPAYAFSAIDERVTITGASGVTAVYLLQRLESRDTNRIKSKAVTFSAELASSQLTSVIWEIYRPTTLADQHGTIASPTQTLIASGTWNISSSLQRYIATFDLPIQANLGLEVRIRGGALTSGTLIMSRPQLEEGAVATGFNCGDYSEELLKCQRYFYSGIPSLSGISSINFANRLHANHPVSMFANPIISMVGNLPLFDGTITTFVGTIITNFSNQRYLEFDATPLANLARIGDAAVVYQTGASSLNVSAHIP